MLATRRCRFRQPFDHTYLDRRWSKPAARGWVVEPIVVEARRGDLVEARHRVHGVAVSDGAIAASFGDPVLVTTFRSSAKPIQALPIVRARPDLDDSEIAIACASHLHRPISSNLSSASLRRPARPRTISSVARSPHASSTTAPGSMRRCCFSAASTTGQRRDTDCHRTHFSRRCHGDCRGGRRRGRVATDRSRRLRA